MSENKLKREWKKAFLARSKDDTAYTAYKSDETKEIFYSHPTKPFLYDREGELIGFRGSDNKPHFHSPDKGWGMSDKELSKVKSVGPIVNKYLGMDSGRKGKESTMYKLGGYGTAKSTLSKTPEQGIRKTEDLIMNKLTKVEEPSI